jgi:hypothetical protein
VQKKLQSVNEILDFPKARWTLELNFAKHESDFSHRLFSAQKKIARRY